MPHIPLHIYKLKVQVIILLLFISAQQKGQRKKKEVFLDHNFLFFHFSTDRKKHSFTTCKISYKKVTHTNGHQTPRITRLTVPFFVSKKKKKNHITP